MDPADVEQVLIGGAFGQYINVEGGGRSACCPTCRGERFRFLGNTSARRLPGAARPTGTCPSPAAGKMTYELSADNTFYENFMSALFLPTPKSERFRRMQAVLENGHRDEDNGVQREVRMTRPSSIAARNCKAGRPRRLGRVAGVALEIRAQLRQRRREIAHQAGHLEAGKNQFRSPATWTLPDHVAGTGAFPWGSDVPCDGVAGRFSSTAWCWPTARRPPALDRVPRAAAGLALSPWRSGYGRRAGATAMGDDATQAGHRDGLLAARRWTWRLPPMPFQVLPAPLASSTGGRR